MARSEIVGVIRALEIQYEVSYVECVTVSDDDLQLCKEQVTEGLYKSLDESLTAHIQSNYHSTLSVKCIEIM